LRPKLNKKEKGMEMRPHTNLSKSNYLSPIKIKAQNKGIILAHGLILERGKIAAQDEYIKGPFCVYIIQADASPTWTTMTNKWLILKLKR